MGTYMPVYGILEIDRLPKALLQGRAKQRRDSNNIYGSEDMKI
jgi:hypothetical protein